MRRSRSRCKGRDVPLALITGGTHGIGLAIARRLKEEGHEVVVCSRSRDVPELKVLRFDALDPDSIDRLMAGVSPDILINNVGGGGRYGPENEVWQKNAGAAAQFTWLALPGMMERLWGRVVCITSAGENLRPWFAKSKLAQENLMRSLAAKRAYTESGITFNCVAPGPVEINGTGSDDMPNGEKRAHPLGRLCTPEEVAIAVSFLCREEARAVNGTTIRVGA